MLKSRYSQIDCCCSLAIKGVAEETKRIALMMSFIWNSQAFLQGLRLRHETGFESKLEENVEKAVERHMLAEG